MQEGWGGVFGTWVRSAAPMSPRGKCTDAGELLSVVVLSVVVLSA